MDDPTGYVGWWTQGRNLCGQESVWDCALAQGNQLEQALWVATAGIWTVLLFTTRYMVSIRKYGEVKPSDWHLKMSWKDVGRLLCWRSYRWAWDIL